LEKGRQTLDKKERTDIYQEFQQFFLEDTPAIFLRYLYSYDIKRG
jgi:ABC-type transport system substrate-binding protein